MLSRRRFLWTAAASAPALALHAQEKAPEKPAVEEPALPPAIAALTDRRKDIVPITLDERNSRLDLARELMTQYSLDAILVTNGASLKYYTGINWWQSERLFAYVIPRAAAPFVICPYLERDHFGDVFLGFPEHETTLTYFWKDSEDPFVILRRVLTDTEIATGTLGIEEKVPYGMANMISVAAPALKIVPATPVTAGCRSLKSPAEIACLRLANQITLDVYKAVYLSCGPGDTSHQFSSLVDKAYERCGVQGEVSCNVGVFSSSPHGSPNPQTIKESDIVMIDDGCTIEGYTSDITRTFVYGKPTDLQRQVFDVVRNAQSSALATAHPGVEMRAVDEAARKVITDAGYGDNFLHRVGHGIGIDMHEWPYLVPGNRQKLMAAMVFSDEPGIYLPGKFGIRLEDDMIITENGAELFTPQSHSLDDPFAVPAPAPASAVPAPEAPTADAPKS